MYQQIGGLGASWLQLSVVPPWMRARPKLKCIGYDGEKLLITH